MVNTAVVLVSDVDAYRLRNRTYRVSYRDGKPLKVEYSTDSGKQKFVLAREIMGAEEGESVQHLNCDPLDCRRTNLRIVKTDAPLTDARTGKEVPHRKYAL